jgi:hypothetical protein
LNVVETKSADLDDDNSSDVETFTAADGNDYRGN